MEIAAEPAQTFGQGLVIYQVYPRSFLDTGGDGVGDLPGITRKLAYIASLGVDAVWLSPFYPSPMRDFGYDVADYCGVDPVFGTLADFDALVAEAHRLGLKLLIDQVYCHTSEAHPWFLESRADRTNPRAEWYVWADPKPDGTPPNNWQSVFYGPAWTFETRRGQYYLHNFLPSQPQLNVHHPAVQDALLEVARFWFGRGVDGLRLDALNFLMHDPALRDNPPAPPDQPRRKPFDWQEPLYTQSHEGVPAFLERLRALADGMGGRFTVAEVAGERSLETMRLYTGRQGRRLDTAYSFVFFYAPRLTAGLVRDALRDWPGGWPAWAFSNHDAPRAVSRWAQGRDPDAFARLLLLLLACLRGHLFLYQGEELGLVQAEVPRHRLVDPEAVVNWPLTLGRDGARTPMPWQAAAPHAGFSTAEPWLPVDPHQAARAVDVQEADPGSTLAFTRRLLAARRRLRPLVEGSLCVRDGGEDLLVFEREHGGERLWCAFNLGLEPVDLALPSGLSVLFSTSDTVENGPKPVGVSPVPAWLPPCSGLVAGWFDPVPGSEPAGMR